MAPPLDPSQPADDFDIPAFPGYLRGVWTNSILLAYVPATFTLYQDGPVTVSVNAGNEIIVSAVPGLPITVLTVTGRVKESSVGGDIGVDVLVNGNSMLGGVLVIGQGMLVSSAIVPNLTTLHNGDLLQMVCTAQGLGAVGLSAHLQCRSKITYP